MDIWLAIYIIGYIGSVVLSIGWQYAYFSSKYPMSRDWHEDMGFAVGWSVFGMVLWPLMLPLSFCTCGFAKYGWRVTEQHSR